MSKFLITGCFGFIGSYLTKYILDNYPNDIVTGVGRNTNQKNLRRLDGYIGNPSLKIIYRDIAKNNLTEIFDGVDIAYHLAAKTFVDYSIRDPQPFIESNVIGVYNILESARKSPTLKKLFIISTDEVYGQILEGSWKEDSPLNPSNPYSSTKACGDMLARSYYNTYKLPVIITRTENVYGPYQGCEKVIPTFVKKALNNEPLPVYGDGKHRRRWFHVEDKCRALLHLAEKGKVGEIYHLAGEQELENLELAKRILKILDKPESLITFLPDHDIRPGHDRRYALDVTKLKSTGWTPKYNIETGIPEVVSWYRDNQWWLN